MEPPYTVLTDRILWHDGDSEYPASKIQSLMNTRRVRWVDSITDDVVAYNRVAMPSNRIGIKRECKDITPAWISNIDALADEDVIDFILTNHERLIRLSSSAEEVDGREQRLAKELVMFQSTDELWNIIRCMVYIVRVLELNRQVWGVGRGSSVSSYLLYVIGVHDVDSYAYDLDVNDFIAT